MSALILLEEFFVSFTFLALLGIHQPYYVLLNIPNYTKHVNTSHKRKKYNAVLYESKEKIHVWAINIL